MLNKCINPKDYNYVIMPDKKAKIFFGYNDCNKNEDYYTFNCGKCFYCQQRYSNDWAVRLMLEMKSHSENMFLTLTYNDENLPYNNSLKKRDVQLFIKRLRKYIWKKEGKKIRYYLTGEYGTKKGRPHYHLVVFGYVPKDLKILKMTSKKQLIYTSKIISSIWKKGFISIGSNLDLKSMKYTAKYLSKMVEYDPLKQLSPFSTSSNRPGIGANAFNVDIYETDGIYLEGKKYRVPRYFDKLAEYQGFDLTAIKEARDLKIKNYNNIEPTIQDKKEYEMFITSQGFTMDHLFKSSQKSMISEFVETDDYGVINSKKFEFILNRHYQYWTNYFMEREQPPELQKYRPVPPKPIEYKQLDLYDLVENKRDFHL